MSRVEHAVKHSAASGLMLLSLCVIRLTLALTKLDDSAECRPLRWAVGRLVMLSVILSDKACALGDSIDDEREEIEL